VPGRGFLLVLEGPEGVGKTTQVQALVARLRDAGHASVHAFREPGGTPLGDEIRTLVLAQQHADVAPRAEALLFMAARAQLVVHAQALLAGGAVVILDRFFLSTYAYQIVGRGLPEDQVRTANALAVDGLRPDLTVLLAFDDAEIARARMLARGGLDRMERESADFHARVTDAFLAAADAAWQRAHPEVGPVARIDADGAPEAVTERILAALGDRWPETFRALRESQ
jgi:dTMP kinase